MELTIDEALQKGIAAHRKGILREAERFYRAILESQPTHPDANHNLGVLAVSVNKTKLALPFFKSALKANPKKKQFWLSYIDALLKENQFEKAKQVLRQGKKQGLSGKELDAFQEQLSEETQEKGPNFLEKNGKVDFAENPETPTKTENQKLDFQGRSPTQREVNTLLNHYQSRRFEEAEKLAKIITEKYPNHSFGWKLLGAALRRMEKPSESLIATQKALQLDPQDAAEHNNLGIILKKLCRLREAAESYSQAIVLKPSDALPHYNLGIALQQLGKLDEAESSYRQSITLNPKYAEAYCALAIVMAEVGRKEQAETNFRKAIQLNSNLPIAKNCLGLLLYESKEYEKAIEQFESIDFEKSKYFLLRCFYHLGEKSRFFELLDHFITKGVVDPMIGSLVCRSASRYGVERRNLFCKNPLKYVSKINLNASYGFEKIFIMKSKCILNGNKLQKKEQGLLTNGYQTYGNLFEIEPDLTREIQTIIRKEIENYRFNFRDSKDGLIRNWPAKYSLYGWFVSMANGGELAPHIHEKGWLSGGIYINVPSYLDNESGNLVVSLHENLTGANESIDVVTGDLCLFPASLYHHTTPFKSNEARVTLAFDVLPA